MTQNDQYRLTYLRGQGRPASVETGPEMADITYSSSSDLNRSSAVSMKPSHVACCFAVPSPSPVRCLIAAHKRDIISPYVQTYCCDSPVPVPPSRLGVAYRDCCSGRSVLRIHHTCATGSRWDWNLEESGSGRHATAGRLGSVCSHTILHLLRRRPGPRREVLPVLRETG